MPGGGHEAGWAIYMLEMYGKKAIEEMHALSRTTKKYTRQEVLEIQKDFRSQIRCLEANIVGFYN